MRDFCDKMGMGRWGRRFARHAEGGELHGRPHRHGWRHGHHHHHGGRHEGRPERLFEQGDLRLVMLDLMRMQPRHGYEIIKAIEERTGGAYSPSPGVVYPTLTLLEELGYVTVSVADGTKKLHTITPQGVAFLEENRATLDAVLRRMDEVSRTQTRMAAPQVVRAMENVKLAMRLRLSRGALAEDQARTIAAALDAAATAIEGA